MASATVLGVVAAKSPLNENIVRTHGDGSRRSDVVVRIVGTGGGESLTDAAPPDTVIELIAEAVKQGVQTAIGREDELIDYPELARRMNLKEKYVRHLKNAGLIHAALDLGKVVRFHYPSVLAELRTAKALRRNGQ